MLLVVICFDPLVLECLLVSKPEIYLHFPLFFDTLMVQVVVTLRRLSFPAQTGICCRKGSFKIQLAFNIFTELVFGQARFIFYISIYPKSTKQHLVIFLGGLRFMLILDRWVVYCMQVLCKTQVAQSTNPCNPRQQSSWGQHGAHLGPVGPG